MEMEAFHWKGGLTDGRTDAWMDGCMDGRMHGWTGGWRDGRTEGPMRPAMAVRAPRVMSLPTMARYLQAITWPGLGDHQATRLDIKDMFNWF